METVVNTSPKGQLNLQQQHVEQQYHLHHHHDQQLVLLHHHQQHHHLHPQHQNVGEAEVLKVVKGGILYDRNMMNYPAKVIDICE